MLWGLQMLLNSTTVEEWNHIFLFCLLFHNLRESRDSVNYKNSELILTVIWTITWPNYLLLRLTFIHRSSQEAHWPIQHLAVANLVLRSTNWPKVWVCLIYKILFKPNFNLTFQIGLSKGMSYVGWKILKDYNGTVVKFSQYESICDAS